MQFSCRGECCLQKSCAGGTNASILPYALQLPWALATVEWQISSDELRLESFTSRTLDLLRAPGLSHFSKGTCPWQAPQAVSEVLERRWAWSTPWQVPIPAVHLWASTNLTATSGSFSGASVPGCREEWLVRLSGHGVASWRDAFNPFTSLCCWNKWFSSIWSKLSASSLLKQNWELK